jgi:transposase
MAGRTRRTLTDEFKAETVALLGSSGRPLPQMSRELGIEQSVLRTWRRKLRPAGTAPSGPVAPVSDGRPAPAAPLTADQAEIRRLRRELERVQMERDILKKAIGIFSGPTG